MFKSVVFVPALLVFFACSHSQPKPAESPARAEVSHKQQPSPARSEAVVADSKTDKQPSNSPSIYFDYDSKLLRDDGRETLQTVAALAKKGRNVRIEGNCDERGTTEYNLALGQARARSAEQYLEQLGVPKSQLKTVSYGSERPKANGHDESAWAENRRDDLILE